MDHLKQFGMTQSLDHTVTFFHLARRSWRCDNPDLVGKVYLLLRVALNDGYTLTEKVIADMETMGARRVG